METPHETAEAPSTDFVICPECGMWDRGKDFHAPACSRNPEPEPEPVRKVRRPRTDPYGNTFPPKRPPSGRPVGAHLVRNRRQ